MVRVEILAADTMGVRSLATLVESASGTLILIDPGAALAPRRWGLPPHDCEKRVLEKLLDAIRSRLLEAHVAVITHYHYDHYLYRSEDAEYYHSKLTLIVKSPSTSINVSQRLRAHRLLRRMGIAGRVLRLLEGDGREFRLEDVVVRCSPPLPHGAPGTPLGWVVAVSIEADGVRIVHASDVQGPGSREALEWIVSQHPDVLIISGAPRYLEGVKLGSEVEEAEKNMVELIERMPSGSTVILDHHLVRDPGYPEVLERLRRIGAERGVRVETAAEYMGRSPIVLENVRRELWEGSIACPA